MAFPDMFSLAGKIAVITGASRGVGREIALGFADAGATVVLCSRKQEAVAAVADEIGRKGVRAVALAADVSDLDQVRAVITRAVDEFGRVDILVNNAGIAPTYSRFEKTDPSAFDQTVDVNLKGVFNGCWAVAETMIGQRSGRIVNMSSISGVVGAPRLAIYAASKGGINQLTKTLAIEWAPHNIRVNAICPSYLETDMTVGARTVDRLSRELLARTPMGRFGRPDEVVGAAIFLASDASSYVTGHCLAVDGGWGAG